MNFVNIRTRCTVKLRKVKNSCKWYLYIETYPLYTDNSTTPKRICRYLNRTITTPQWDVNANRPKRNKYGIIVCKASVDKEACRYAESIRFLMQQEYDKSNINELYSQSRKRFTPAMFVMFFKSFVANCRVSDSMKYIYCRVSCLFESFLNTTTSVYKELDCTCVEHFRSYLLSVQSGGNKKGLLSSNSVAVYLSVFKTVLKKAFRDGLLLEDISSKINSVKCVEPLKEYLTIDELNKLLHTPCRDEVLKRAALFSALTGLRHCDIRNLKKCNLCANYGKYILAFIQRKTGHTVYLPISHQAYMLCYNNNSLETYLFFGLQSTSCIARPLKQWIADAGIKKKITFHCFRHTYATLQLAGGTDIHTLSKMMGHSSIRTTQIYAKIVDENKMRATNVIILDI